jgi:CheY-like chemotaxis protein
VFKYLYFSADTAPMKKVILYIEDNPDIRDNAEELLLLNGFDVICADSGENALGLVQENLLDLIICDIIMAGMDGYEVYEKLRADARTAAIPFIFSTAKHEKADIAKAKQMGIMQYLIKPFDENDLLICIKNCLDENLPVNAC